jgi:Ca2+-binding RTX toxin-like protein
LVKVGSVVIMQVRSRPIVHGVVAFILCSAIIVGLPSEAIAAVKCQGKNATRVGTAGNDNITGTANADVIAGLGGNDVISGLAGADTICGGPGTDQISGGDANDVLAGESENDTISGDIGTDTVSFTTAPGPVTVNLTSHVATGDGTDQIMTVETVIGSAFADTMTGSALNDRLDGRGDNDILLGLGGNDRLLGGDGDIDSLEGGDGRDILSGGPGILDLATYLSAASPVQASLATGLSSGGAGSDTLQLLEGIVGSPANDQLTGDANLNVLGGGAGNDSLSGGGGTDFALFQTATGVTANLATLQATGEGTDSLNDFDGLIGGNGPDSLTGDVAANLLLGSDGNDVVAGGTGDDELVGGAGNDNLQGGGGRDKLEGDLGADTLNGGTGLWHDTAMYVNATGPVTVSLSVAKASGADGADVVQAIEDVTGSPFDDSLTGNGGANTILAGGGNDSGFGLGGNDYLDGELGTDSMTGGAGSDVCYAETVSTCEVTTGTSATTGASSTTDESSATGTIPGPTPTAPPVVSTPGLNGTAEESTALLSEQFYIVTQQQWCLSTSDGGREFIAVPPDIQYFGEGVLNIRWDVTLWQWDGVRWNQRSTFYLNRVVLGTRLALYAPWFSSLILSGAGDGWHVNGGPDAIPYLEILLSPGYYAITSTVSSDDPTSTYQLNPPHGTYFYSGTTLTNTEPDNYYCTLYAL